ncbi:VOC family protein [Arthrobacter sp. Y81]|uniref:VOC family protein n=1 Tax=Arthrobacter sp. Y81 TaxID=2058897 RepID=UPI0015E30CA2|nr:hypothetical protein [Arthrobacter sp. Y81]
MGGRWQGRHVSPCLDSTAAREQIRTITKEPQDQPWGKRVAYLQDPDGSLVVVATGP